MAVSQWDPLRELLSLQQRMNRLFDSSLSKSGGVEQQDMTSGSWTPPVDIYEGPDKVVLRADVPGLRQEELEVRIENNVLTMRGERRLNPEVRREDFLRIERPLGAFHRSFSLPLTVDQSQARAELRDGVLELTLFKKPEQQTRSLKIDIG